MLDEASTAAEGVTPSHTPSESSTTSAPRSETWSWQARDIVPKGSWSATSWSKGTPRTPRTVGPTTRRSEGVREIWHSRGLPWVWPSWVPPWVFSEGVPPVPVPIVVLLLFLVFFLSLFVEEGSDQCLFDSLEKFRSGHQHYFSTCFLRIVCPHEGSVICPADINKLCFNK